jgi:hypothetical protein
MLSYIAPPSAAEKTASEASARNRRIPAKRESAFATLDAGYRFCVVSSAAWAGDPWAIPVVPATGGFVSWGRLVPSG